MTSSVLENLGLQPTFEASVALLAKREVVAAEEAGSSAPEVRAAGAAGGTSPDSSS